MNTFNLNPKAAAQPKSIVTTALAYSNANLHLGHALEAILADIFVRTRRAAGQDVIFLGANDNHGTATELTAETWGKAPLDVVNHFYGENTRDYARLGISFDTYHQTASPENHALAQEIYLAIKGKGHIRRIKSLRLFDETVVRFLEDRRVRGTCPECARENQPGNSCDCGATYEATDLINPRSTLSDTVPVLREVEHLYLDVNASKDLINSWLKSGSVQAGVASKLKDWTHPDSEKEIQSWCVSRQGPYFGIPIPGEDNLFFYVWLDAPIGYLAALQKHLGGAHPFACWNDPGTEVVHIIGKDITAFHAILWPAILSGAGLKLPDRVHAHGFLTIDGEKISKSKGNGISVEQALSHLSADQLRFALAARLTGDTTDGDINAESVLEACNTHLVGKIANIALRLRPILSKHENTLDSEILFPERYQTTLDIAGSAIEAVEALDLARAVRQILKLADFTNAFVQQKEPWKIEDVNKRLAVVTQGLNEFRVLAHLVSVFCPEFGKTCLGFWGEDAPHWESLETPILKQKVQIPKVFVSRLKPENVEIFAS